MIMLKGVNSRYKGIALWNRLAISLFRFAHLFPISFHFLARALSLFFSHTHTHTPS